MEKPPEAMENKSGAAMENESAANESDAEDAPEDTVVVVEMPEEPEVPVVRFDVTAKDYTYTPSNFTVKKGSRVRFSITAVDRSYGFAIMDYGVSELIMVGQTKVVSFIADKPGTFEIKNTHITSGAARDMRGTLVVEE
jgi:heme/copper-type cytochrome/quinol oxidase subunit 2